MEQRWVTKHALTEGIKCLKGERSSSYQRYFRVGATGSYNARFYGPKDHHTTKGDAIIRAEQMRDSRIKALQKQIEKLQAMEFHK